MFGLLFIPRKEMIGCHRRPFRWKYKGFHLLLLKIPLLFIELNNIQRSGILMIEEKPKKENNSLATKRTTLMMKAR